MSKLTDDDLRLWTASRRFRQNPTEANKRLFEDALHAVQRIEQDNIEFSSISPSGDNIGKLYHPVSDVRPRGRGITWSLLAVAIMMFSLFLLTNQHNSFPILSTVEMPLKTLVDTQSITFSTDRDGNWEIYATDIIGVYQLNLTNNLARDFDPDWSPDGSQIAFASDRSGSPQIFIMNADGSGVRQITFKNDTSNSAPDWSPDGSQITFHGEGTEAAEIYVMNVDGSNITQLTNDTFWDGFPLWSHDGQRIAYTSFRNSDYDIFIMNIDGSSPMNITNSRTVTNGGEWASAWSRDDSKILGRAFLNTSYEVFLINSDGSNPRYLTSNQNDDEGGDWSPDDNQIVFVSSRDGNAELYIMNTDGSDTRRLTNNSSVDAHPSWKP